jgi:hypothetical protein
VKRLLLLVLALFTTALLPQILRAQATLPDLLGEGDDESTIMADSADGPQRIGIPAASFELDPSESGAITGYCFDEHLIAPTRVTSFSHILAGGDAAIVRTADGRERSLRQAVREGDVAIRAQQLNVAFLNRTNQPMQVRLTQPTVLWDRSAGQVNPLALAALAAPNVSSDARQKAIWKVTNTERRLHGLGYLSGSMYDYDQNRFVRAINDFQRDHGMSATAELDIPTIQRVATVDQELRDRLRNLGFTSREGRFAREDLGSQIRSYEKFLGRPASGRWNETLATSLASTETIVPQLNLVRPAKGEQIADVLSGDKASNVLTYLNDGKGLMVLAQAPSGVELWSRAGRSYQVAGRDADAARRIDRAAAGLAQRASKDGRVVIYPGLASNGSTPITVGDRTVEVSMSDLKRFVEGGDVPKPLETALATLVPPASSNQWTGASPTKTFVIYRSPLQQGRAAEAVASLGLEQVDAGRLAGALDRAYGDRMSLYVSNDLRIGADRFESSMGSLSRTTRGAELAFAD